MRPSLIRREILKLILKQECGHVWTRIIRIRIISLKGCCENDDELPGYV